MKILSQIKNSIRSKEFYFFLLISIVNVIPAISYKFHPTLDGPSHLYNTNIINHLLFDHKGQLSDFFVFNKIPVPNWTGHFLLSLLTLFLPAFLAEKVFLVLFLIGLSFSFRALIKSLSPNNVLLSYLIFPFTYSFLFYFGFYSFIIGVVFIFITLTYWLRNQDNYSIKHITVLGLLLIITYFSHLFVFLVLLMVIGLQTFTKAIINLFNSKAFIKEILGMSKSLMKLLFVSIIPLILLYYYLHAYPMTGEKHYLKPSDMTEFMTRIKPITGYTFNDERHATLALFKLFFVLFLVAVLIRIVSIKTPLYLTRKKKILSAIKQSFELSDFILFAAMIMLILFYTMPDFQGDAGFFSARICYLFYLLLISWIAVQKFPKWICFITIFISLFYSYRLNDIRKAKLVELNKFAIQINNSSKLIKPNSVVLPVDYSNYFNMLHYSNYLGIDKPIVVLENYECNENWFPLSWNEIKHPHSPKGITSGEQIVSYWFLDNPNSIKVDYIFLLENAYNLNDSSLLAFKSKISKNYSIIDSSSNFFLLYQLNRDTLTKIL